MFDDKGIQHIKSRKSKLITALRFSVIILAASAAIIGCQQEKEREGAMPTRDINLVMKDHVNDLMAIPDVTGVAIGQLDDGTPCIQVLIVRMTDELKQGIPKSIEGHPVVLVVSGVIRKL